MMIPLTPADNQALEYTEVVGNSHHMILEMRPASHQLGQSRR